MRVMPRYHWERRSHGSRTRFIAIKDGCEVVYRTGWVPAGGDGAEEREAAIAYCALHNGRDRAERRPEA